MRPDAALAGLASAPARARAPLRPDQAGAAPASADEALAVAVAPAAPSTPAEAPPRRVPAAADIIAGQGHGRDSNTLGGPRPAARPRPRDGGRAKEDDKEDDKDDDGDGGKDDNFVVGGEIRMDYLSLAAATSAPPLRMNRAGREPALKAARPSSRIECMRRCASNGFCDPSDDSGCGGEYCLAGRDLV